MRSTPGKCPPCCAAWLSSGCRCESSDGSATPWKASVHGAAQGQARVSDGRYCLQAGEPVEQTADVDGGTHVRQPHQCQLGAETGLQRSLQLRLQLLLPRAVDDIDQYEYLDGEIVAGIVIGWNFGEGHLHNMQLLRTLQEECQFEEGELRCIFVESQPMGQPTHARTIADAASGVRETGKIRVRDLLELQPWPTVQS